MAGSFNEIRPMKGRSTNSLTMHSSLGAFVSGQLQQIFLPLFPNLGAGVAAATGTSFSVEFPPKNPPNMLMKQSNGTKRCECYVAQLM